LLHAFKKVEQQNKAAFLLIGGPDAGWEDHCKNLAKKLKLRNYLFIGNVQHDAVQEHFLLADVFVLPTRLLYEDNVVNESWGLTVNEAMSLGIPVVATTAVAAAYDLVKNGESGYRVLQKNIPALAHAINRSLANKPTGVRRAFERWNNYNTMFAAFKQAINFVMKKPAGNRLK